jgi:hypothetical protein
LEKSSHQTPWPINNGFRSKLDIPVSLDTKCTFGGVSRDSVEILIKMHRNQYKIEKLTILTPPPRERAPVSSDTKCSFGGFSHKSVENAQKSIQNGMTDIFETPLQDSA